MRQQGGSMQSTENAICPITDRAYRRRLAAVAEAEVLFSLSDAADTAIDEIKERHGLRNRGQVLEQQTARELLKLFEQRREAAEQ